MASFYKTLIEIQEKESFEKLEPLKSSDLWIQMTAEERDLFAFLLNKQGAQLLAIGDLKVLENFNLAVQVSPSPLICEEQGLIFALYPENIRCLNLAHAAFTQATERDSSLFTAWYHGAQVLVRLGLFDGEGHYFLQANQKFETAADLLDDQRSNVTKDKFYWQWGFCLTSIGKYSGEPLDFYKATNKYRMAADSGCQEVEFFNNYGHALVDLAALLDRQEFLLEALELFTRAIDKAPESFDGWYNQACCLHRLAEVTTQDDYLIKAYESFAKAAAIDQFHSQLWLKWGQLESMLGKVKRDVKKIESALEKLAKANELEPDQSTSLSCWGETELFLASHYERLDLIYSAKAKIVKSLELQPDKSDNWYLYGSCFNELGRYFSEEKYYQQAIEKFQYGLSLARQNPLLWYGLALAHFALGELNDDATMFEKASRYCGRVIECGGGVFAQFWNDWGVALLKLAEVTNQPSHIESAIEKFERALKQPIFDLEGDDIDLEWMYNYGCAFDLLGDLTDNPRYFEKAILILTQVIQLDPDYVQARYNLALALSHLGEATCDVEYYHKALEHFHILLEHDHEDEMAQMDFGISLVNLALLIHDVHHPERVQTLYRQAEIHLMQAVSLGNCEAYYQLAGFYSITGHYSIAMHYLERAQSFNSLPAIEDLMHDDWLEGLKQTSSFRQFINELSSQQSKDDKL
jgi:tetratricopeptide (TPR) repeat protein